MKKIASLLGATTMLLVFAMPASAWMFSNDEATIKNFAWVNTDVSSKVTTGFNKISGGMLGGSSILTGTGGAFGTVSTQVNTNTIGCGCYDDLYIKNKAGIRTDVDAKVNTGFNTVSGGFVMGGLIGTGDGVSENLVTTIVNTNIVGD